MNCGKQIGIGNTATVYEWEEGKVLKLFYSGYPKEAVEREFSNAMALRNMKFAKPKAYEIISYEDRVGIIYERVEGESLLDWVMRTGDVEKCAIYMAKLHSAIIQNEISNVPNYKDFLIYHTKNALQSSYNQEDVLEKIYKLSDGNTLCHGDFHPGNILITDEKTIVIDFMNICHGHYLYDIARTVYLVEYTPVPAGMKNKEELLYLKKLLTDLYLKQMNVNREMIQDYLMIIALVRKGECPNE